jgi:hypothetical protein
MCKGGILEIRSNIENANDYKLFEWYKEGNKIGDQKSLLLPKTTDKDLGTYKFLVKNDNNCQASAEITLNIPKTDAVSLKNGGEQACVNQAVVYSINGKEASENSYAWNITPNDMGELTTITSSFVAVRWLKDGNAKLSLTKTDNKGCKANTNKEVTINSSKAGEPSEIRYFKVNNLLYSTDSTISCYQWDFYHPYSGMVEITGERYQLYAASKAYNKDLKYWVKTWAGADCSKAPPCANIAFMREQYEGSFSDEKHIPMQLFPNAGTFTMRGNWFSFGIMNCILQMRLGDVFISNL